MKLDSPILINLVLLFMLSTMGGTLWFLLPTRESMQQARLAQAAAAAQAAASGKNQGYDLAARWRGQLAVVEGELQSLRLKKKQLDADLLASRQNAQPPAATPGPQDVHALPELLARRQTEVEQLELELAGQPGASGTLPLGARSATRGKEAIVLQLYGDRVLPVDERYYSVRTIDTAGTSFRVMRRTSPGESLQQLAAPASKFQLALSGVVPARQYLRCLVAEDSFALLREIMSRAAAKGIDVVWESYKDEDGRIVLTAPQS